MTRETEVLIVGAGVIGLSLARELTRRGVSALVIDRESDIGMGISKSCGGFIAAGLIQAVEFLAKELAGLDPTGELDDERAVMLRKGCGSFHRLAHDLAIPHRQIGCIVLARNDREEQLLRRLLEIAEKLPDTRLEWLDRKALRQAEPNVTEDAVAGVRAADGTILVFPYDVLAALDESARAGGAGLLLDAACLGIEPGDGGFRVATERGTINARFVVNCAGKYADRIADMAGARRDWKLVYFRTESLILDRRLDGILTNFISLPPNGMKVEAISPLLDGKLLVYGGTIDPVADPEALETTREGYDSAIASMQGLLPALAARDVVTSYTGVRVYPSRARDDHLIEASPEDPRFITVIPWMPGFAPAVEISSKVAGMLARGGLALEPPAPSSPTRRAFPRFRELDDDQRNGLIAGDPRFGWVVCRCETVTEGEIVEAIRRGANTVQGVMFRTGAGMGRCQRNFCGTRIMEILAREKRIGLHQVTFKGGESTLLAGPDE